MLKKTKIITAVDIGTSKICALLGEASSDGRLLVLAHSEVESGDSVCKGELRNIEDASNKLFQVFQDLTNSADEDIDPENIFFSVTGNHIHSIRGVGSIVIQNPDRKITMDEILEARRIAHQVSLPFNCVAINYVEADYMINGERKLENPLGHVANRLDAFSYCIYGDSTSVSNFRRPLEECGFSDGNQVPVFSGVASAMAALTAEDLKHGSLLMDIGAGTCEYLLFHGSGYFDCGVIPVGCEHIANDLAIGLDLPIRTTRNIMIENLSKDNFPSAEFISVPGSFETRKIPSASVEKIVELRIYELYELVHHLLKEKNIKSHLGRGIVICGGAAKFPIFIKCAEKFFDTPIRTGFPREIEGSIASIQDPRYTCAVGLLKHGANICWNRKSGINLLTSFDKNLWSLISKTWKKINESIKF